MRNEETVPNGDKDMELDFTTLTVAIDGPSGAGKSTVAKKAAAIVGLIYVDTGALYRTVGLYMLEHGISDEDADGIVAALPEVEIRLGFENGAQEVYLCGEPVGEKIRTEDASRYASAVSKLPPVRDFLLDTQRDLAKRGGVVMDGRDIGTVIMPDADVKVFYTASAETRAERRFREQRERGMDVTYEEILAAIEARDKQDSEREVAPLKPADDAIVFYNDPYPIDACVLWLCGVLTRAAWEKAINGGR
ncbi:MAG: (d)CMP kinase [Ruminococcaceae bacterium]|jgi:cytidylate kinase|nr:(d)CMP kinase [Oscillospiraceae bacterium]